MGSLCKITGTKSFDVILWLAEIFWLKWDLLEVINLRAVGKPRDCKVDDAVKYRILSNIKNNCFKMLVLQIAGH